jgi:hypothetical protein
VSTAHAVGNDGSVTVRESWAQSTGVKAAMSMLQTLLDKGFVKNDDDRRGFFRDAVTFSSARRAREG